MLLVVCAGPGQGSNFCLKMVPLFPCHLLVVFGVLRRQTLVSSPRETFRYLHLNLPLGVTNEGREAVIISHTIKQIFGAVVGDSSLQDKGVAHYILSLLFSLVSLLFSFYLSVLYQKS